MNYYNRKRKISKVTWAFTKLRFDLLSPHMGKNEIALIKARPLSAPQLVPPKRAFYFMRIKRLLSYAATFHCNKIPLIIKQSLQSIKKSSIQSDPPLIPKGPSILATNIIKSYFDEGLVEEARTLFDEMPERDVVSWTVMISGYTSFNCHNQAWTMFVEMVRNEVNPNAYTLSSVLKACKGMKSLSNGALVHGMAIKEGLEGSIYVENSLMDVYATCCISMDNARLVFNDMKWKNDVSWTTLITGYAHRGNGYGALGVFKEMLLGGVEMSPYSFSIAVRACPSTGWSSFGKLIHAAVIKHGFGSNLPVMNSILDMYCRFDCLSDANQCFDEMTDKDLITWNTIIAGYEKSGSSESLNIFSKMESEGFSPNCFTFTSIIAACATLAALSCGKQVHAGIVHRGLDGNLALANALIDMYAKCGNISDSQKIFSEMSDRDLVTWTSMMIGYGAHGYGKEAIELFDEMVKSGVRPDRIVFMAVLTACSHAGLVDEGLRYFKSMNGYNVYPSKEIYGCVVDLLGRAGRVKEAYELIESMPFKADESVWGPLLGACKEHRLPNLGKLAALRVLDLKPNMMGTYVILSNIYAAEGKWEDFAKFRKIMKGMGSKKEVGMSWIEVRDKVCSFIANDKMGSHTQSVYGVLKMLIRHMNKTGYAPHIDCLIHDLEGEL